jgi:60 kDa SS-A/Ro ribonucleoprotein
MPDPLTTINTRETPQQQRSRPEQVRNRAGGYVFQVGDDVAVRRFLTLGTTGGTFYATEQQITRENADVILRIAQSERAAWLVEEAAAISIGGRAPRQNPALFVLAAVAGLGPDAAKRDALRLLPQVARTGTALFTFCEYVQQFRGWGRVLRRGVAAWYTAPSVDAVAFQAVKYRQRNGWTHRDVLRQAHPEADGPERAALFEWIVGRSRSVDTADAVEVAPLPSIVEGYELARQAQTPQGWAALVARYGLTWEMLPDEALGHREVWRAMISNGMGPTALMRQLPRLTRLGVLDDLDVRARVVRDLTDPEVLRRGRVHPVNVLVAQRTYAAGVSVRGTSTWTPVPRVVDALDTAFYAAFGAVQPAGKRTLIALDVSGSMAAGVGDLPLTCREVAAALALVMVSTEPQADVIGFCSSTRRTDGYHGFRWSDPAAVTPLDITPRRRLDDVVDYVAHLPSGATDCALPMTWAREQGRRYDSFVIVTDNETWHGQVHPHQALERYRRQLVPDARLAVVALTPTGTSIADPKDPGQLDVSGFDSAVPGLLSAFFRRDI